MRQLEKNFLTFFSLLQLGKDIENEQQICHSHGLHLAVCDTMYVKKNKSAEIDLTKNLDEAIFEAKIHIDVDEEFTELQKLNLYYLAKNVNKSIKSHLHSGLIAKERCHFKENDLI